MSTKLKKWREDQKLSKYELSKKLNVSGKTISNWEDGGKIRPNLWRRWKDIYGIDVTVTFDMEVSNPGGHLR